MRNNYYRTIKKKDEYKTTKNLSFKKKKKLKILPESFGGLKASRKRVTKKGDLRRLRKGSLVYM